MYTVPLPSLPRNIAPLIFESVFPNTEVEIVSKYATIVSVRPIELCFVSADTDICQCRNADIVSANYRWVISCRYLADIIIGRTLTIVPAALGAESSLEVLVAVVAAKQPGVARRVGPLQQGQRRLRRRRPRQRGLNYPHGGREAVLGWLGGKLATVEYKIQGDM